MSEATSQPGAIADFESVKQRSLWIDALERLVRNKAAILGLVIAILFVFSGTLGPYLAPRSYTKTDIYNMRAAPTTEYWLGTDAIGRDVFSRIIHGARTAVLVVVVVLVITVGLGVFLGSIAAYVGRWVDDGIMRLTDITMAFPGLLLAAFLATTVRLPVVNFVGDIADSTGWDFLKGAIWVDYLVMFGALSLVNWAAYARLIRGQILSLRERDFIRAVQALGIPTRAVIMRHLVPNAMGPVIVAMTLSVGEVIMSEAALSYLGFGIQPPGASWGNMISEHMKEWRSDPLLVTMPGIVLAIAVFGFNFLGDGINDAVNPRQIRR